MFSHLRFTKIRAITFVTLLSIGLLTLAAYTNLMTDQASPTVLEPIHAISVAAPQPPISGSGFSLLSKEALSSYNLQKAHTEAYWYSRYNLGNLVMRSGLGVQLKPPMEKVQQMMEMAGIAKGPANPYLVRALYRSGDPHLIQEFNGDDTDFANFRWDQSEMDKTVTPQAMGYTIIKEVIWAKSFASDVEGPDPMNHFRAVVLSAEAAAQAQFAEDNLRSSEGLFVPSWKDGKIVDANVSPQDQMVMLWALSELSDYAGGAYGYYAAPVTREQALAWADELVDAIEERTNTQPDFLTDMPSRDIGVALSALSSYAGYAPDGASRTFVVETLIPLLAKEIIARVDDEGRLEATDRYSQVATQATAIHGLVFASKITKDKTYEQKSIDLWRYMESLWDETVNLYVPSPGDVDYRYTTRDVGDIIGAFNAMLNGLGVDVDQRFADFFQAAVNRSGLQIAEARATGGSSDEDTIPVPANAGGPFGQAPVLATEVLYYTATGTWEVTDPRFTTAYAMLADNQMMWISIWGGEPSVPGHGIPLATVTR